MSKFATTLAPPPERTSHSDTLGPPYALNLEAVGPLSDQVFMDLCRDNPLANLERASSGELIVMAPSGTWSENRGTHLLSQLYQWNGAGCPGEVFGSSAGFRLDNSAIRSPDVSWVVAERWNSLTREQREGFAPLCPDFVAEIASRSDSREALRRKMREYIEQGARLGWLIDPYQQEVEIYRPDRPVEILDRPATLSGEDVLPGLIVDLVPVLAA